ncbi:RES family NAD+ phosphorylase [Glutamicibacter sp. AOP3-A1-12]|uniref:RES family NAD+ phosphorylase n=1 Tax=Glutamicibacter sp. AOP3-A1-12 TaxID=3457701 RepID=UPI00403380F6
MTAKAPKNPRKPPVPLTLLPHDLRIWQGPLWRIRTGSGAFGAPWNNLREYGPIKAFRWEPHPVPVNVHPGIGVSYTTPSYVTAFAEVFQTVRAISFDKSRTLSAWSPIRPLQLLDLTTSTWLLRHRASASLNGQPKNVCRAWAKEINLQLGAGIDGIYVNSTMVGMPMVVLFSRARTAFPMAPAFSRNLTHIDVLTMARKASVQLGWPIV